MTLDKKNLIDKLVDDAIALGKELWEDRQLKLSLSSMRTEAAIYRRLPRSRRRLGILRQERKELLVYHTRKQGHIRRLRTLLVRAKQKPSSK